MKGTSSLTLLGLVGVVGLLPHNTLALPAEHHNTTSTSSGDGGVMTMQSCVVKPGWWIGCCDHKTDSNLGDGGDCKDYSEKELNINKIGDCEKDSADHGPYCFFGEHSDHGHGMRLDPKDE